MMVGMFWCAKVVLILGIVFVSQKCTRRCQA